MLSSAPFALTVPLRARRRAYRHTYATATGRSASRSRPRRLIRGFEEADQVANGAVAVPGMAQRQFAVHFVPVAAAVECISTDPTGRLRDIAAAVGITDQGQLTCHSTTQRAPA